MDAGKRRALLNSTATLVAATGLLVAFAALPRTAAAGDLHRYPDYDAKPASPPADVTAKLEQILDEERARQKARDDAAGTDDAAAESDTPTETPAAAAPRSNTPAPLESKAVGDLSRSPGQKTAEKPGESADVKSSEAKAAEAEPPAPPVAVGQAGCMYRGTQLIWEKVPGTCSL